MACTSNRVADPLSARVEDLVHLADKHNAPCFLGFLDLREQAIVRRILSARTSVCWDIFGGYDGAERAMLAVFPDFYDATMIEYPFVPLAFHFRSVKKLSHRDVLGTLMSAGLRRDVLGDILCGVGLAVVYLRREVVPFVCEQVDRIGGEGVTVTQDYQGELPIQREYQDVKDTIASSRLDAVVKALLRSSREEAAELIRGGFVSLDHLPIECVSASVSAPCTISVRGYGRFLVDTIGPPTKKGRLMLHARKCI